jgi:hypothetical protein
MAARKAAKGTQTGAKQTQSAAGSPDAMEQRLVAFAEQLGTMVGNVQRQAEGWLDRESVRAEVARIRDSAGDLLEYVNSLKPSLGRAKAAAQTAARKAASKRPARPAAATATASAKANGRGPVDAPGKRHRQPPPQERGSKRMNQPKGSQTAPAIVKSMRGGARG